jgi:transposase
MERTPSDKMSYGDLLKLVLQLQEQLAQQARVIARQAKRIEELESELKELRKKNPTQRLDDAYSVKAEEKRREDIQQSGKPKAKKQKSKRRGRISTAEKLAMATLEENIFPAGYSLKECAFRYSRVAWRIINGQAVLVAYHIYAGPDGCVPLVPGVPGRGEFGREIITALAWQHMIAGLPLDTVIGEFAFYWNLTLRKSQADSILNRLAKEWLPEFDALCQLLAVSAVVYADETSWSINSVWAFLSKHSRITVFGCRKDGDTLAVLLKKDEFQGILVTDDAAVYQGFSKAQKCWAHLLRKAIRLTLLKPERKQYDTFVESLLEIYRKGKAIAADKRLSEAGRRARVEQLVDAVCDCTGARFVDATNPADEAEKDFLNLTHEIVRLMSDDELFTFVIYPEADGTNNISERQLRAPAQDRVTGRTNKTECGARRRTVITSVLDSLRGYVPTLTLTTVLQELERWQKTGISCFRRLVKKLRLPHLSLPAKIASPLELLVPMNKSPAR